MDREVSGIFVRRSHGELVAVGLAENDGPGIFQSLNSGRRVRRDPALQDFRPRGGLNAFDRHHVFDRDWDARQRRQRIALVRERLHRRRLRQRTIFRQRQISANLRIVGFDLLVELFHQRDRIQRALGDGGAGRFNGKGDSKSMQLSVFV